MSAKNKPTKGSFIKKHNSITLGRFDMSVIAYRMILLASSSRMLAQLEDPRNNGFISISAEDYHEMFGRVADLSNSYKSIKSVADELLNAKIRFKSFNQTDAGKGSWVGGTNWTETAVYNDKLKILQVKFTAPVLPLLYKVQEQYTYYNLTSMGALPTIYSIRLYELIMSWRKKKATPALSIELVKAYLSVPDTSYTDVKGGTAKFTQQIVKKSIEDICEFTDLEARFETVKKGRSVVGYRFFISNDRTGDDTETETKGIGNNNPIDEDGIVQLGNDEFGLPNLPF